jgi:2-C-methyl-D-erythritol 4-phosphate cytidylyltransferase
MGSTVSSSLTHFYKTIHQYTSPRYNIYLKWRENGCKYACTLYDFTLFEYTTEKISSHSNFEILILILQKKHFRRVRDFFTGRKVTDHHTEWVEMKVYQM